ncbi:YdeI/OmpD-associated family protein [Nesterenkonia flava]|uniref:YdeI/OmpD-associated family protein n=1 Tax=Nesterenkonia flava TaxID=469799 RepID=A0ABU1FSV2_9MICC|nr:YdeI/OmpD-associated family protein [Nesterenkonia flava]MDR5711740.1 YdeI/OmpD-associated family protein [Nesterenkonia flava]
MAGEPEILVVADAAAWRTWLDEHEETHDGVWLMLAKKGTVFPTSLTYAQALDEALCSGWIDGQKRRYDDATFIQRFTLRRARSMWSARNVEHIQRLRAEGRIRPRGEAEVAKAQADGRWDRAYAGSAAAVVPADLITALEAAGLRQTFDTLSSQERYSILHQLMTAATEDVRARRLQRAVANLQTTTS